METEQNIFSTTCYSCNEEFSYNLDEISDHRVENGLNPIELNSANPRKYHARCTHCAKFCSVFH